MTEKNEPITAEALQREGFSLDASLLYYKNWLHVSSELIALQYWIEKKNVFTIGGWPLPNIETMPQVIALIAALQSQPDPALVKARAEIERLRAQRNERWDA